MPKNKLEIDIYVVEKHRLTTINMIAFVVGMIMVWKLTHNGWALFWTWIASMDAVVSTRSKLDGKSKS